MPVLVVLLFPVKNQATCHAKFPLISSFIRTILTEYRPLTGTNESSLASWELF